MADSTTHLDTISSSQSQKEVTANAGLDAASPATLFGRRASTTAGLTWGYYGGKLLQQDGTIAAIANGTVSLTGSTTNYVEATRDGTVSANTSAFTAGRIPLYTIVTGSASVTSYTDHREGSPRYGLTRAAVSMSDANYTVTTQQARCMVLSVTGTLTVQRDFIVPNSGYWIVRNATTGGFGIQVKTSGGSGIVIANGMHAIVYADGTNVLRATADV